MLKLRCCCLRASEIQAACHPVAVPAEMSGTDDGGAIVGEDLPLESFVLKPFQWDRARLSTILLLMGVSVETSEVAGGYDGWDSGLGAEHQWDAVNVCATLWVGI